jgi:hypothetical protein
MRPDHPLLGVFDWKAFELNPSRLRFLSDLGQVVDAMIMRIGYPSPAINFTGLATGVTVPVLFYITVRTFELPRHAAAAVTALLISTTGYLSVLLFYCRPAKPISMAILSVGMYYVVKHLKNKGSLIPICTISVLGLFADELLWCFIPFAALWTLFRDRRNAKTWICWALVPVAYGVIIAILKLCYRSVGKYGPRPYSTAPSDALIKGMFSTEVWALTIRGTSRKLLTFVGFSDHTDLAVYMGIAIISAFLTYLILRRDQLRRRFILLATSAALSFCAWGQLIHSFSPDRRTLEYDYASYAYYYHSPIAVLMILCLATLWPKNAKYSVVLLGLVAIVVLCNFALFTNLNRVVQLAHLGIYASEDILHPLRSHATGTIVLSNPKKSLQEFEQRARQLSPSGWTATNMYRDFSHFRQHPYVDDYGNQLCRMFTAICPVNFDIDYQYLARDERRKADLRKMAEAFEAYRMTYGRYPTTGDNVWSFSTDPDWKGSKDPLNDGQLFWSGYHSYGVRGWRTGCDPSKRDRFFIIGTSLEAADGRPVRDCDGEVVPWPRDVWVITSEDTIVARAPL